MANIKITEMPQVASVAAEDLLTVVQGGAIKKLV